MSIVNATNFRKKVYDYLDSVTSTNDIVTVTTKSGNAVLINEDEYRSLMETAYLNSIPGMAESIIEAMNTPSDELAEIDWENELSN